LGTAFVAGTNGGADTPATGARAVLAAALETKTSIEAQQAFHTSRQTWADDNLAPEATVYNALVAAKAAIDTKVTDAETRLTQAKNDCKVAAFKSA